VVLSSRGREQAEAVGAYLADLRPDERPESLWVSPYRRAVQTGMLALEAGGIQLETRRDERLRDRELGILDALTGRGVRRLHPTEAERRNWLGKFYYRPPGGESWVDVALRVRFLLADLDREEDGKRVLIVCHDAVIRVFRYVCERLDEETLMTIARTEPVPNGSLTRLVRPSGTGIWRAEAVNAVEHLRREDAPVTEHRGDTDARTS
jgi:broad specificity phosphatase PhoE